MASNYWPLSAAENRSFAAKSRVKPCHSGHTTPPPVSTLSKLPSQPRRKHNTQQVPQHCMAHYTNMHGHVLSCLSFSLVCAPHLSPGLVSVSVVSCVLRLTRFLSVNLGLGSLCVVYVPLLIVIAVLPQQSQHERCRSVSLPPIHLFNR